MGVSQLSAKVFFKVNYSFKSNLVAHVSVDSFLRHLICMTENYQRTINVTHDHIHSMHFICQQPAKSN